MAVHYAYLSSGNSQTGNTNNSKKDKILTLYSKEIGRLDLIQTAFSSSRDQTYRPALRAETAGFDLPRPVAEVFLDDPAEPLFDFPLVEALRPLALFDAADEEDLEDADEDLAAVDFAAPLDFVEDPFPLETDELPFEDGPRVEDFFELADLPEVDRFDDESPLELFRAPLDSGMNMPVTASTKRDNMP
jgi:hypothetical protein